MIEATVTAEVVEFRGSEVGCLAVQVLRVVFGENLAQRGGAARGRCAYQVWHQASIGKISAADDIAGPGRGVHVG